MVIKTEVVVACEFPSGAFIAWAVRFKNTLLIGWLLENTACTFCESPGARVIDVEGGAQAIPGEQYEMVLAIVSGAVPGDDAFHTLKVAWPWAFTAAEAVDGLAMIPTA